MEIFKRIELAPNYEVSNKGLIRSIETKKAIAQRGNPLKVNLYNERLITETVKKLVALAFVPNPNRYSSIIHLDNDKTNCSAENLVWGTWDEHKKNKIEGAYRLAAIKGKLPNGKTFYATFTDAANGFKTYKDKLIQAWNEGKLDQYNLKFERYADILRERKNNLTP